jgi:hypothetical protein
MEYRLLGLSGCTVSALALGTLTFGNQTSEPGCSTRPATRGPRTTRMGSAGRPTLTAASPAAASRRNSGGCR